MATTAGMPISIRFEPFAGTRKELKSFDDGAPIFNEIPVVFNSPAVTKNVHPGEMTVEDTKYGFAPRDIDVQYKDYATLRVHLGLGRIRGIASTNTIVPYWGVQSGVNFLVNVREVTATGGYVIKKYGATTDNQGYAIVYIPVKELPCDLDLKVAGVEFEDNTFKNYYSESGLMKNINISGIFSPYNTYYETKSFNSISGSVVNVTTYMQFSSDDTEHPYRYTDYNWYNALFE